MAGRLWLASQVWGWWVPAAHGDRSPRVAFDAVGDRNPVPGRAACPRPGRRAPGRVECPRPQEVGGRLASAEGVLHRPEVTGWVVLVGGRWCRQLRGRAAPSQGSPASGIGWAPAVLAAVEPICLQS